MPLSLKSKKDAVLAKQASKTESKSSAFSQLLRLSRRTKKEPGSAQRRSGRQRIAPVEYWNGAAVMYDDDGTLIGVEAVGALPPSQLGITEVQDPMRKKFGTLIGVEVVGALPPSELGITEVQVPMRKKLPKRSLLRKLPTDNLETIGNKRKRKRTSGIESRNTVINEEQRLPDKKPIKKRKLFKDIDLSVDASTSNSTDEDLSDIDLIDQMLNYISKCN